MPKYRTTICQDEGFSKGMWFYAPIDIRKKYYFCNNCQGHHLVKEGLVKEEVDKHKPIKNYSLSQMIEMAKNSEYGAVWYSEKGPIKITKDGELEPIL